MNPKDVTPEDFLYRWQETEEKRLEQFKRDTDEYNAHRKRMRMEDKRLLPKAREILCNIEDKKCARKKRKAEEDLERAIVKAEISLGVVKPSSAFD